MRRAFVDAMIAAAESDPRVVFLTGDLGFQMFDEFRERFGPRYINVGIAEAQMMLAAAGLAIEGFRPVAYSIASFCTGRPFEQIRISVAYPRLPVLLVGAGGGYCYAASGTTHHAAEDLALMSLLPDMTVVAPGDPGEVRELVPQLLQLDGPSYIRIGRFGEPTFEANEPPVLGRARLLREGKNVAVISTGEMAPIVLEATDGLAQEGMRPIVYQFHTVKPLDTETLNGLATQVRTVIIAEESTPMAGLGAAIATWHSTADRPPELVRLGPPDCLALGNLRHETLREKFGYGPESIKESCRRAWGN